MLYTPKVRNYCNKVAHRFIKIDRWWYWSIYFFQNIQKGFGFLAKGILGFFSFVFHVGIVDRSISIFSTLPSIILRIPFLFPGSEARTVVKCHQYWPGQGSTLTLAEAQVKVECLTEQVLDTLPDLVVRKLKVRYAWLMENSGHSLSVCN